jgi:hypothetical protein
MCRAVQSVCADVRSVAQDAYELPEGDMSGVEEERAEAEKAVEESKAAEKQKSTL